jgi:hypothetical protein
MFIIQKHDMEHNMDSNWDHCIDNSIEIFVWANMRR